MSFEVLVPRERLSTVGAEDNHCGGLLFGLVRWLTGEVYRRFKAKVKGNVKEEGIVKCKYNPAAWRKEAVNRGSSEGLDDI